MVFESQKFAQSFKIHVQISQSLSLKIPLSTAFFTKRQGGT